MSENVTITSEVAQQMAQYVAAADPILAKQAAYEEAIPAAVDALVSRGLVLEDAREVKAAEFKEEPAKLIEAMSKLAAAPTMGAASDLPGTPAVAGKSEADLAYESALLS